MALHLGITVVSVAWLALAFTVLQLVTFAKWRGLVALLVALGVGGAVVATRADGIGLAWLRAATWRGDAVALGATVPLLALAVGIGFARESRAAWATVTVLVAALATIVAGFDAFWIDRGAWHWDTVAISMSGCVVAWAAGASLIARNASPNRRIVFGCTSFLGCFVTVSGGVLLAASNALA
ncbi:MAG: hypothetical protein JWN72_2789 [Thermoleophilia bacterium]|nr:hypothetical protein [Thermoleophilia bacterium]